MEGEKTPWVSSHIPLLPREYRASRAFPELAPILDDSAESTSSSISFEDGDFANIPSPEASAGTETTEIPPPLSFSGSEPMVFFDLETSDLGPSAEILQISAMCGKKTFNRFSPPENDINPWASQVNGLTMKNEVLCKNGKPVPAVPLQTALTDFLKFLASVADAGCKPALIGHNIQTFDMPILLRSLRSFDMIPKLTSLATSCLDTLKISRKAIPRQLVKNYKQMTLVEAFLGVTYGTKDARKDVFYLQQLYQLKLENNFDPSQQLFHVLYSQIRSEFSRKVKSEYLTDYMAERLAVAGLSLDMLRAVFERDGEQGIRKVLSAPCGEDQRPRISKNRSVSTKLSSHFALEKERTSSHGKCGVSQEEDNAPREFSPFSSELRPAPWLARQDRSNESRRAPLPDLLMKNYLPSLSNSGFFSSRMLETSVRVPWRRAGGTSSRKEFPTSSWLEHLHSLKRSTYPIQSQNRAGDGRSEYQNIEWKSNLQPSMSAQASKLSRKGAPRNEKTPSPSAESASSSWSLPSLSSSSTTPSPPPTSFGEVKFAGDGQTSRGGTAEAKTLPSLRWTRPNIPALQTPREIDHFSGLGSNRKTSQEIKKTKRLAIDSSGLCKKPRFETKKQ